VHIRLSHSCYILSVMTVLILKEGKVKMNHFQMFSLVSHRRNITALQPCMKRTEMVNFFHVGGTSEIIDHNIKQTIDAWKCFLLDFYNS
jgi:hypothetical protein